MKDAPQTPTRPTAPSLARRRILGFTTTVWAWAFYDLANTVFSALFVSVSLTKIIVFHGGGTKAQVGTIQAIGAFSAALLVPFLGTLSDKIGRRLPFLLTLTLTCCLLTPLTGFVPLKLSFVVSGLALFAYYAGLAIYDALLPDIAEPAQQGKVSGLGVGIGYFGTILAIAATLLITHQLGENNHLTVHAINFMIGGLFLAFATPLFLIHRERATGERIDWSSVVQEGLARVVQGARLASKTLWIFIFSTFFFVNAAMAVIIFFYAFATEIVGLSEAEFYPIYALLALAAVAGSIAGGWFVDRTGPRSVLFFAGFLWIVLLVAMMFFTSKAAFVIVGMGGGAGLGLIWTASRPMLAHLGDPERMGETFGFLGFANRASAVLGPFVFGVLSTHFNYVVALATLIGFFVVGLGLLAMVPPVGGSRRSVTPP